MTNHQKIQGQEAIECNSMTFKKGIIFVFLLGNIMVSKIGYILRHDLDVSRYITNAISISYLIISMVILLRIGIQEEKIKLAIGLILITLTSCLFSYFILGFYSPFSMTVALMDSFANGRLTINSFKISR